MKVLLLGAKGMLGNDLQKSLQKHEIIAWDKEELDISNEREVKEKIKTLKPDFIINAAAFTDVEGAEDQKESAFLINATAAGYLAKVAHGVNAPLLHFSTDYVFDGSKNEPYNEDDPKNPLSVYGKSKAEGEDEIIENTDQYFIVRTSWLYGKNGKNFVQTMLNLAQSEKKELNVVDDQIGSPTYTVDLANAIIPLLSSTEYGIYHLTNNEYCSWYEFSKEIFRISKYNVTIRPVNSSEFPQKAKRPKYSILKNNKLPLLPTWKDAVKRYIQINL